MRKNLNITGLITGALIGASALSPSTAYAKKEQTPHKPACHAEVLAVENILPTIESTYNQISSTLHESRLHPTAQNTHILAFHQNALLSQLRTFINNVHTVNDCFAIPKNNIGMRFQSQEWIEQHINNAGITEITDSIYGVLGEATYDILRYHEWTTPRPQKSK